MSSPTNFVNLALAKIGGQLLDNINEEPLASLLYKQALEGILRDHPWNFAEKIIDLPAVPITQNQATPGNYDKAFDLPGDFLKLTELEHKRMPVSDVDYRIIGRTIWTVHDSLTLTYVRGNPEASVWTSDFVDAFTSLLASKFAETILQSQAIAEKWAGQYENADLPKAKKNDVRDSPGPTHTDSQRAAQSSPLVNARHHWNPSINYDPRYFGASAPEGS